MINQNQVDQIRRLLADGKHSQRQIASLTGLSRGTIGTVASGQRPDRTLRPGDAWDEPPGPIVRCPGCGGRVYAPCRLCHVRQFQTAERVDRRQQAGRESIHDSDERRRRLDPDLRRDAPRRN